MMEIAEFEWTQGVLIEALVKGAIALCLGCLAVFWWRRRSAAAKHLILMSSFVTALMVPLLTITLPKWEVVRTGQSIPMETSKEQVALSQNHVSASERATILPIVNANASAPKPASTAQLNATWDWRRILIGAWGLGLLYCLARLLASAFLLRNLLRSSRPVDDARTHEVLSECQSEIGVTGKVILRNSGGKTGPLTCGIWRPAILLPASSKDWSLERLRVVLLHELAHIRRFDVATHFIARVACAFYWFNPFAWLALRRSTLEREQACDDLVLQAGFDGPSYARHLLELARGNAEGRVGFVPVVGMAQRAGLEQRVESMLRSGADRRGVTPRFVVWFVSAMSVCMIPLAMLAWERDLGVDSELNDVDESLESLSPLNLASETSGTAVANKPSLDVNLGNNSAREDVIVEVENGRVHAIDSKSRKVLWVTELGKGETLESIEIVGDVISAQAGGEEYLFDRKTGELVEGMDSDLSESTRVFRINGMSANDALKLAESVVGKNAWVAANEKQKTLICRGTPSDLKQVERVLVDVTARTFESVDVELVDIDEDGDMDLLVEPLNAEILDLVPDELSVDLVQGVEMGDVDLVLEEPAELMDDFDADLTEGELGLSPTEGTIVDVQIFGDLIQERERGMDELIVEEKGVQVTISEIGGVRVDRDMLIQARVVGDRFEDVTLLVDHECSFLRVSQMVRQLKEAGFPEIRIATKAVQKNPGLEEGKTTEPAR